MSQTITVSEFDIIVPTKYGQLINIVHHLEPTEKAENAWKFHINWPETTDMFKRLFEWMANNAAIIECSKGGKVFYQQDWDAHIWKEGIKRLRLKKLAEIKDHVKKTEGIDI